MPKSLLRTIVSLLVAVLTLADRGFSADESVEWWTIQREVTTELTKPQTQIAELAAELSKAAPANEHDALFKLDVLMRAGMIDQCATALRELKALDSQPSGLETIYYDACHLPTWDIAKATVEIFADNIVAGEPLLQHLLESGWTVETVDAWLRGMPPGVDGGWVKLRLRFNRAHGRGDALEKELADRVRENPQDIQRAGIFLDALNYPRDAQAPPLDLTWTVDVLQPNQATDVEKIARYLMILEQWQPAASFYRRASQMPLTGEETRELKSMYAALVTDEFVRAAFAVRLRENLANCLLELKENDEAQKWMVDAANIRKQHRMGRNALLAGRSQRASGGRDIERRIEQQEQPSLDDPEYWFDRAIYYQGRRESAQEEQALLHGLKLDLPEPAPGHPGFGRFDWHSRFLRTYALFLIREKRSDEAVALVRDELSKMPAKTASTMVAVHILTSDLPEYVRPDDEILWKWLENRPQWEYTEERLLWMMLAQGSINPFAPPSAEKVTKQERGQRLARAERLARGEHLTRAYTLGSIMHRMGLSQRSVSWLVQAADGAREEQLRQHAQTALYESYLYLGEWQRAEELFPQVAQTLGGLEAPNWHARLAVGAARSGATADAMRLWERTANLCPTQLDPLRPLVDAGLNEELKEFYRNMRKQMPTSEVPERALADLKRLEAERQSRRAFPPPSDD